MKILVCIKQVPGTTQVEIDPATGTLKRDGIPAKMNPFDLYALETAIRIRDDGAFRRNAPTGETSSGGCNSPNCTESTESTVSNNPTIQQSQQSSVTVLTMGPPQCEKVVREAFMMGADRGIILSDRAFGGADVLMTSYTLAQAVKKTGPYDLIVCGKQTTDGDTAQVGAEMAEWLGIPHVVNVKSVEGGAFRRNAPTGETSSGGCNSPNCTESNNPTIQESNNPPYPTLQHSNNPTIPTIQQSNNSSLTVTVDLPDEELVERIPFPFLMTVEKGIFEPRLPSYRLKCATADREIAWLGLKDLDDTDPKHYGLNGSPTQVKRIFPPEAHVEKIALEGDDKTKAAKLAALLEERKFLQ